MRGQLFLLFERLLLLLANDSEIVLAGNDLVITVKLQTVL